jgi:pimeloyl-ACP methyl ester carboxylesterase
VPEGTAHYPHLHNLGSRNFTSDDSGVEFQLGELVDATQFWYSGAATGETPLAVRLGDRECIERGETPGRVSLSLRAGWDARCPVAPIPPSPPSWRTLNALWIDDQVDFADIHATFYADANAAANQLADLIGPVATTSFVANGAGPFPGTIFATSPNQVIVIVSGTSNASQWALQIAYGTVAPVDVGGFKTSAIWNSAAEAILQRMEAAGLPADREIVFVGHSYGGAVAQILAARVHMADPMRRIQLLTFGAPVAGNAELGNHLASVNQVHYVNTGDPVANLPPSGDLLKAVSPVVPAFILSGWRQMDPPRNLILLQADGSMEGNPNSTMSWGSAWEIVRKLVAGDPITVALPHLPAAYRDRLDLARKPPP